MCAGHFEFAMNDVLCSEDVEARSEVAKAPPYKATPDAAELSLAVAVAFGTAWLWRGIWLCIDDILFPDSRWRSATAGLGIGVALFLALAWLRPRGAAAALRRPGLAWFLDACYSYVGVWVSVLVWRGFWYLGDGLFARDAAVSHACGFFALLGFGALRSACAAPMFLVADAAPPLFSALAWDDLAAFDPRRRLAPPPTDARSPNGA